MADSTEHDDARVAACFAAWNAGDADALLALFVPDATYEDPTTGAPIAATGLTAVVAALRNGFPDLAFEPGAGMVRGSRHAVEWVLRGHNLGPYHADVAATGRAIALAGVAVFELEPAGIRSLRLHYDRSRLAEQLGLMALVQPVAQGPARFGYSMRLASGNRSPPGVIALTWIEGANEAEKQRIRAHARQNVADFLAEPGFIAIVTGFTGLRGFTVTAWEDEAALKRALSRHHAVAMRELFGENFVASVWTSVWQPLRNNRLWLRCPACASLEDLDDDHRACRRCGAPLPERPEFW